MGVIAGIGTFVAFAMADQLRAAWHTDEMYTLIYAPRTATRLLAFLRTVSRIRGNYHDDGP